MSREELWTIYTRRNPQFANEKADVRLTGRGLRKLFEQTWDKAHEQGVRNGRALEALNKKPEPSIFEKVFGRSL